MEGKIIVCDDIQGFEEAYRAGALWVIMLNDERKDVALRFPLPAFTLAIDQYGALQSFLSSTKDSIFIFSSVILQCFTFAE